MKTNLNKLEERWIMLKEEKEKINKLGTYNLEKFRNILISSWLGDDKKDINNQELISINSNKND